MPKNFIFVEKHYGYLIPFQQNSLKDLFEQTNHKIFDGACAGVVAALLECSIVPLKNNLRFFAPTARHFFLPSASRCLNLQNEYEQNVTDYFTIFIRDILKINETGFADQDGFGADPLEILNKLSFNNVHKNELVLMNAIYHLDSKGKVYTLEHKLCLLKLNNKYIFCEPNYGIVLFNTLDHINEWLMEEIALGALEHYVKPVKTKMVISDHVIKEQGKKEGILTVSSVFFEYYSFPIHQEQHAPDAPNFQSRL
ncbi:hypothetical protein [uncultured Legionella sp.]|uniref:hypothetical protein n=1 Tax=uncultured Legionella sp. TaxID=210934 RepID=UPI002618DA56|nr:hypothetical protein [uncultured Legionella sp.]